MHASCMPLLERHFSVRQCLADYREIAKNFQSLIDLSGFVRVFIDGALRESASTQRGSPACSRISKQSHWQHEKIYLAVSACGLPVAFDITGGKINDGIAAPKLIAQW